MKNLLAYAVLCLVFTIFFAPASFGGDNPQSAQKTP